MGEQSSFRRPRGAFPLRFAVSDWEIVDKIDEKLTLQVSARGDGLCLYLPKDLCDVYRLIAGDRVKVGLGEHFRRRRQEE